MNGHQIEAMLQLIEGNIDLTRDEVAQYIREHQQEIAESLATTGNATIHTKAGDVGIAIGDLEAMAA